MREVDPYSSADPIEENTNAFWSFWRENRRRIIGALVAGAAVALGLLWPENPVVKGILEALRLIGPLLGAAGVV